MSAYGRRGLGVAGAKALKQEALIMDRRGWGNDGKGTKGQACLTEGKMRQAWAAVAGWERQAWLSVHGPMWEGLGSDSQCLGEMVEGLV